MSALRHLMSLLFGVLCAAGLSLLGGWSARMWGSWLGEALARDGVRLVIGETTTASRDLLLAAALCALPLPLALRLGGTWWQKLVSGIGLFAAMQAGLGVGMLALRQQGRQRLALTAQLADISPPAIYTHEVHLAMWSGGGLVVGLGAVALLRWWEGGRGTSVRALRR